jgi:hypothetical protein
MDLDLTTASRSAGTTARTPVLASCTREADTDGHLPFQLYCPVRKYLNPDFGVDEAENCLALYKLAPTGYIDDLGDRAVTLAGGRAFEPTPSSSKDHNLSGQHRLEPSRRILLA